MQAIKRHGAIRMGLLAIGLAAASGMAFAQQADALTAPQVRAQLEAQGYTKVEDLKFDDGMWKADATSADGKRVDVRLDPRTGTVYPDDAVSNLSEADVRAKLSAAGYIDVHDVEFDDGLWKADARTAAGAKVELKLDPQTGDVVGKDKD